MVIRSRQRIATLDGDISLSVNGLTLQQVETTNCLCLTIDQFLTWRNHLQSVRQKVGCGIRILKRIRPFVALEHLINVYRSIVEPYFTYCRIVEDSTGGTLAESLQKLLHIQNIWLIFRMNLRDFHTGSLPLGNKDEDKYDNRLILVIVPTANCLCECDGKS